MTVNGKHDNIGMDDLVACASHMNIKPRRALYIIEEVREAVREWTSFAEAAELPEQQAVTIERTFPQMG